MVGLVFTDLLQSIRRVATPAATVAVVCCFNCCLVPNMSLAQLQPSNGWGKASSDAQLWPVNTRQDQRAKSRTPRTEDRLGDQKASSTDRLSETPQQHGLHVAAVKPVAADQRIRLSQQGDRKASFESHVFQDANVQPASNTVLSIPQQLPRFEAAPRVPPISSVPPVPSLSSELDLPVLNVPSLDSPEPTTSPFSASPGSQFGESVIYQNQGSPYSCPANGEGCNHCQTCRKRPTNWINLEALIWWTSDVSTPPLATISPAGTPAGVAGIVGPNSNVVFGGQDQLFGFAQGGFRARLGQWSDAEEITGVELDFLLLAERGDNFFGNSNGGFTLARPFTDVSPGQPVGGTPSAQLIAFPGTSIGSVSVNTDTRFLGGGGRYLHEIYVEHDGGQNHNGVFHNGSFSKGANHNPDSRIYLTLGPRYYQLDDSIGIGHTTTDVATGNDIFVSDAFETENKFLGAEIGLKARRRKGRFLVDLGVGLGIGGTQQELDISGTTITRTGATVTRSGSGLLAQSTNIGSDEEIEFSLVPRLELDLEWDIGKGWSATVGYNLLYWTNILRAGEQIDGSVNTNLLPPPFGAGGVAGAGTNGPVANRNETDYFAQGISFGIERRF